MDTTYSPETTQAGIPDRFIHLAVAFALGLIVAALAAAIYFTHASQDAEAQNKFYYRLGVTEGQRTDLYKRALIKAHVSLPTYTPRPDSYFDYDQP